MGLARGGKTLAYGFGDHDYGDVTTCPGSKRILEWFDTRKGWRLSVRKAETMETISTQDLRFSPGFEDRLYYLDVACRSRSGDSFAVAAEDSRGRLKLIRYSNGERSRLYDDQASLKALDGRHLYLTQEGAARRLKVFNMRTDQVHFVARFPARPWQVALSPDRSKVAAMTSSEKPLLMVVDRGTNPHTTHTRRLDEYASGRLLWIDDDELGFFGGGGDFGGIKLFKPSLDVSRKVGGPWYANDSVRVGDAVYGIGWGTLFRWDTAEANSHVLREFQSPNIGSIAGTS
jgi:hypothetical protein